MNITELRSYRIARMAIFDWVATIVAAVLVAWWSGYNWLAVLIVLLIASVVLHIAFGVRTWTNYYIGVDSRPDLVEKK